MSSTLSKKIESAAEAISFGIFCALILFFEFIFYPRQAKHDLWQLLTGEYKPRYSASEQELDWIDEEWRKRKR